MGTSFEVIDYDNENMNLKLRSIYVDILCDMRKKEFEIDYQYDLMYKILYVI